jgi:hypothetical protein
MTVHDFSFAAHAPDFDRHIRDSIPGLDDLRAKCVGLSRQSIENGTTVIDIGCSAGALLRAIRDANQPSRPSVRYLGIDKERSFGAHWRKWRTGMSDSESATPGRSRDSRTCRSPTACSRSDSSPSAIDPTYCDDYTTD